MAITFKKSFAFAKRYDATKQHGFTLVEMLVVVGIFAMVATVLLFRYSDFNTSIALRDLAAEMGLSIRKAQTYATSVRSVEGGGGILSDTFPAYGVSFAVNPTAQKTYGPTDMSFTLFVDASPSGNKTTNNQFDNNGTCGNPDIGQECVESFGITAGDKIVSLCTDKPLANSCFTSSGTVNVVFHRPNPDAIICVMNGSSCTVASYLKITVQSPKGQTRLITIWNTGQISVN